MPISERQKNILMAIIEEFMSNADEIGSVALMKRHNLGVSSATIRSEMVRLMEEGLLEKSHISSGRFPTDQAIRLYVKEIAEKRRMSAVDEVEIRQGIFKVRFSQDQLIKEILDMLVRKCDSAAFFLSDDDRRYYGVSSLMHYEELRNVEILQRVLDVLEDKDILRKIFSKYDTMDVSLLIGAETGIKDLENCSIAFTKVGLLKGRAGHMGIIGSRRLDYSNVMSTLSVIRDSVENSLKGWN
ncbi:MAG: Transcriptional regulator of heat shock protein [candidate division WS6 bacterium GW2011_GWF2_39_15]|uniref:Transcriptional regulator of heat shock protein n=1 Tax=candidate division WS6 bacterium GW2011_GWF2_39_15 TaxID=1619100 RepID=A0A0G0MN75_9BACT|nr:MAG: Transcriptional regulator of heat shock protein [candidate division WS6 bacterium GW2011_GWF2_39_15]